MSPAPARRPSSLRRRLDLELVRRGLAVSRERARAEIEAGRVTVGGAPAGKPGRLVAPGEAVALDPPAARFVSRGGEKLAAALDTFEVPVAGADALDAGASTGGFTDCLLQRGAAHVTAVDVGRAQLHQRLAADPRVTVVERANVRHLTLAELGREGQPFSPVVADLSFISLRPVAPALLGLAAPEADLIVLVKPQFEAGRREAARGRGVISDPDVWRKALEGVVAAFTAAGAAMMGVVASPLLGAKGNVEFLAHVLNRRPPGSIRHGDGLEAAIDAGLALRAESRPSRAGGRG